ncbi:MAG: aromatic ring-hydroxylating dioxygenase subunit alpha [Deltaproteobacteria bacterium]|nr:aromatic ring-hydroxylating dioxygenase subunit alpha [Deltaproteobacteria bacterium]
MMRSRDDTTAHDEHDDRRWSIPASWYTSSRIAALERARVFGASWAWACHEDDVGAPGSWVAGTAGDLPWVVVRGADGELRAFANVCRHKAALVCEGRGRAERLVCPYHGWAYRLDGTLASAPRAAGMLGRGLAAADLALPRLGLTRFGPFVLVHRDAAAIDAPLAPLASRLWAEPTKGLVAAGRRTWDVRCNWKVFVDNYLDGGYHVAIVHPSLGAQLALDAYRTEVHPTWSLQSAPPTASPDAGARERIGAGALYAWLWPNIMINRYGPALDVNLVHPTGPDTCRVEFHFWFDRDRIADPDAFIPRSVAQSVVTQDEDVAICERVQLGVASRTWDRGPLAPNVERAIAGFHRALERALGDDGDATR